MTQIKHERSTQDLVRAAVSGWLGTALEFMDFQLYSLGAALVFHEIFFPEQSAAMALILAMGTYGAGYIARIIGAFVFGKMGDRIGRKKVLFITITMMGICTTLIGVLPTYAQIGIFAPVLLVTLRIIQGLGAGAEISGAGTMLAEYAPKGKRGIISSLVAMGTNCGTLSATAIWAVMFFALEREQLIARDGVFLSGERRCHDIRDLAANESERKPGIRKSKRRRKIASVNACVRKYIGRDVYQQIFLAGHRFAFWTSGEFGAYSNLPCRIFSSDVII